MPHRKLTSPLARSGFALAGAILLATAHAPSRLRAQDSAKAVSALPQDKDKRFVLEAGTHRVEDLIQSSAKFLRRNCLCAQTELNAVQNKVIELQSRLELDAKGCEEAMSQLLYSVGLVLTRVSPAHEIYEWIHAGGQRRNDIPARAVRMTSEEVMMHANLKMVVATTVLLRHINAMNAANQLRPFFQFSSQSTGGLIVGSLDQRTLMVMGYADEVGRLIRMLQDADQPPEKPEPGIEERLARIEARIAAIEKKGEGGEKKGEGAK